VGQDTHAEKVKVAHPLMLRAITAAKKKNDRIDAAKIADCLRRDFLPECYLALFAFSSAWSMESPNPDERRGLKLDVDGPLHIKFHFTSDLYAVAN